MADKAVLDRIDEKFRERHKDKLVTDGVVDFEGFNAAKRKILWVLKEGNDPEQTSWSLCDVLRNRNILCASKYWKSTFGLICRVSWALLHGETDFAKAPQAEAITDILKEVAVINLKKIGGPSRSTRSVIAKFYKSDKDLIGEQVGAISPDIIIDCSGIWDFIEDFKTGEVFVVSGFRTAAYNSGVIMTARHPAYSALRSEANSRAYFQRIIECLKK
jgi:hypothetical protein